MNRPDARLLNPMTQNYLRQQAIRLREQGKRMGEIATYLGVHRNTSWLRVNSDLAPSSNSSTTNVLAHLPLG